MPFEGGGTDTEAYKALPDRHVRELCHAVQLQLLHDVLLMGRNGCDTDEKD